MEFVEKTWWDQVATNLKPSTRRGYETLSLVPVFVVEIVKRIGARGLKGAAVHT